MELMQRRHAFALPFAPCITQNGVMHGEVRQRCYFGAS
jgi:hypothetical protein